MLIGNYYRIIVAPNNKIHLNTDIFCYYGLIIEKFPYYRRISCHKTLNR